MKVILEFLKSKKFAAVVAILIGAAFAFQNCAKVDFSSQTAGPLVGVSGSSIDLIVTGGGLPSTGVTSFTAIPGQTYVFTLSGSADAVTAGLNNATSAMTFVSGQCSGSGNTFQPFTMDLTQSGAEFQFGDNSFSYNGQIAESVGGCVWQICAVDNNTDKACVQMTAGTASTTTTTVVTQTTMTATPTTVKVTPTTMSATPTTVAATPTTVKATTTTQAPTPTTQAPTPTTQAPPPTSPPTTQPPPPPVTVPTPTTLPPTAWNCYDGYGVCGTGIAIIDNASVSPSNPGSSSVFLKANPSNGAPNQRCQCSAGTKTMISCNAADSTGYYVCSGGSTALPACRWPGDPNPPGPYCYYVASGRYWYCSAHNNVAEKVIPCP